MSVLLVSSTGCSCHQPSCTNPGSLSATCHVPPINLSMNAAMQVFRSKKKTERSKVKAVAKTRLKSFLTGDGEGKGYT
jgi:hypothetical protein